MTSLEEVFKKYQKHVYRRLLRLVLEAVYIRSGHTLRGIGENT